MARRGTKQQQRAGYGRLLDAWVAPQGAGDPVGAVATSFTFNAAFFEEECLARFLGVEADPLEDGPVYLIEREEKLASIRCATVLVDQHHCRGTRSLRWDLLPVRVPKGGVMHAKVSLLYWANLVRVIVASANLTDHGYRRNQEIFGVLDFALDAGADSDLLPLIVEFLRSLLPTGAQEAPDNARLLGLLEQVDDYSRELPAASVSRRSGQAVVVPVFSGQGRTDVISQLEASWPGQGPAYLAYVTSPFFDPPEAANRPAKALWGLLRQRGAAEVTFNVVAEQVPGESAVLIRAPESLKAAQPQRRVAMTYFSVLSLEDTTSEVKAVFRPLHLKSLWLQNQRWATYLIGSSNFTSAGLGLGAAANIEANLLYIFRHDTGSDTSAAIDAAYPQGEPLSDELEARWESAVDDELEAAQALAVLPSGFSAAIYGLDAKDGEFVEFHFGDGLPDAWSLTAPVTGKVVLDHKQWVHEGSPTVLRIKWSEMAPPSGFDVIWAGAPSGAWLPVVVQDAAALPPPDELKALPLDLLIQILTSGRPLHEVMRRWLKARGKGDKAEKGSDTDPHGRVDTGSFLLQRTRRISWALEALKRRLSQPMVTQEALTWRLCGPVGVHTIAEAISREALSDSERVFLISELVLALAQVQPAEVPGSLPVHEIQAAIKAVIRELHVDVQRKRSDQIANLTQYVDNAFAVALS